MNSITIFSARIARELIQSKKFELLDISPDKKVKIKTVFYFENTPELRKYLKEKHNIEI